MKSTGKLSFLAGVLTCGMLVSHAAPAAARLCVSNTFQFITLNNFIVDAIERGGFVYDAGCEPPSDLNNQTQVNQYNLCLGSDQRDWSGRVFPADDVDKYFEEGVAGLPGPRRWKAPRPAFSIAITAPGSTTRLSTATSSRAT